MHFCDANIFAEASQLNFYSKNRYSFLPYYDDIQISEDKNFAILTINGKETVVKLK